MVSQTHIDLITERVERLLVRHEEMQRTIALLKQQASELTSERDQLRSQCQTARQRIDALLQQLPPEADYPA
jgi:cell division septum initiation protein DivIVA